MKSFCVLQAKTQGFAHLDDPHSLIGMDISGKPMQRTVGPDTAEMQNWYWQDVLHETAHGPSSMQCKSWATVAPKSV